MPGVGEALKREIAGLGLVEQRYLWGFDGCCCFGFALSHACLGAFRGDLSGRFAFFWSICVLRLGVWRLSHGHYLEWRIRMGPRAVDRTAEVAILDLWRTYHAAAFAVVGGALGCHSGVIALMMISWPPQHGQGIANTRGGSSVSPRLSLLA